MTRRHINHVGLLLLVVASAGALFMMRPGGSVGWVITTGGSMEPLLSEGDLVLIRQRDSYEVGAVVAYQSTDLRSTVLHRIVGIEDDQYVLQGDANDWTDSVRPGPGDVTGEMIANAPAAGRLVSATRDPRTAAVLAGGVAFVAGGGLAKRDVAEAAASSP